MIYGGKQKFDGERENVRGLRGLELCGRGLRPLHPSWRTSLNTLTSNFRQLMGLGLTYTVLQKYAATQKMTGNEQARSGHFCLCGYGAKAPLRLASQPHFWSGAARKFGKERTRGWGRSAQQAEDCEAIPKNPADGWSSLLVPDSCWIFHWPQTALCSYRWAKLAEIV